MISSSTMLMSAGSIEPMSIESVSGKLSTVYVPQPLQRNPLAAVMDTRSRGHGPSWSLIRQVAGKAVTRIIPPDAVGQTQAQWPSVNACADSPGS